MTRTMYDSVTATDIPLSATMVAGYINGTYAWSQADWDRFPHAIRVRIATRANIDDGHVLDVEQGAARPYDAPGWVQRRRAAGIDPTVYCNQLNDWPLVRQAFAELGVPQPHYWLARYNNVATIPAGAIAKQYANPPTHHQGHFDLSVVADYWPGIDPPQKGLLMALTDAEQRFIYNRIAGFLDQRYYTVDADGVAHPAKADDPGAIRCTALDTRDGNYLTKRIETLEKSVQLLTDHIALLFGTGYTIRADGEITVRASQVGNGG